MANYCDGCFYQKQFTSLGPYCDYICMVGKRRPCPPGDGCTAKLIAKKPAKQPIQITKKGRGRPKVVKTEEEIAAAKEAKRAKNREYSRKRYAEWTQEDREKDREKCRKYYHEHREERIAAHKKYREANRDKINARNKARRLKEKEEKNGSTSQKDVL